MTYSASDLAMDVANLLRQKGYVIYQGDGYETATADESLPETASEGPEYDERIDGFWFTWSRPGMSECEVGDTFDTELQAWADALAHWLRNTDIAEE